MDSKEATGSESKVARQEVLASEFRNVQLPAFWKHEPKLWFMMLEKEFQAYNVKVNAVKTSAVVRNLDPATMRLIIDIIEAPEDKSTYEDIKQALLERLESSDETKLRRLLTELELGDRKPSELLREMKQLAGGRIADSVLRTMWVDRLPARVREVLAIVDDADLVKLAKIADKITARSSGAETAVISDAKGFEMDAKQSLQNGDIAVICNRLEKLEMRLARRDHGYGRGSYRRRSTSRRRSTQRNKEGFCYYHAKFGAESWRCRKPCSWTAPDKRQGN
ncbi:uncharacterized protein LOC108623586 [Ceratina calcarata]|uniref:Uncharacterized protein LOC108622049 n=1 Tax=Ceratina calcarata TaxID=156304 RepID=A0AAJ7IV14_9HYME|nr:uncharacterized protein LOC108622049 [Ceratina calcarata]XP_017877665.1 uncharacterized protein LOC108623586 [Ceratina calcarata]